jgi:hypothetical protein
MNTWMYRMRSWRRSFAIAVASMRSKPRAVGRSYWDRQSRTWSGARRLAYVLQRAEPPVEVRRRPR